MIRNSTEGSPDRVDALVWGLTELFDKMVGRSRKRNKADEDGPIDIKYEERWGSKSRNHPQMWMAG